MTPLGRRHAEIGNVLRRQVARARALASHRERHVPPLPGSPDPRIALVDAELFTARPWPGDRSGHVSPEWDIVGPDVALTASPRDDEARRA